MSRLSIALCIAALVVAVSAAVTAGRHFPESVSVDRSLGWSVYASAPHVQRSFPLFIALQY